MELKAKHLELFYPALFEILFNFKGLDRKQLEIMTSSVDSFDRSDYLDIKFNLNSNKENIPIFEALEKIKGKKGKIGINYQDKTGKILLTRSFKVKYIGGHEKPFDHLDYSNDQCVTDFIGRFKEL